MANSLEDALAAVQERNRRVEIEKAWETSAARRGFIAVVTYTTAYLYMAFGLNEPADDAFLHAFVPAGGYILSTFSLPIIKNRWIARKFGPPV